MFTLRFDLRAPATGAPAAELYAAALDMAEWGERNGALAVVVSEHHASDDGYLPAPLVLAAAIAGR
ncbi:MAG TPA: LLM class flavin-dependent oxidoreductase, partial [Myxococcota bacterium]|nr:LLM class flavin-dependent oxidoreductase [Myxococcota bacterium]